MSGEKQECRVAITIFKNANNNYLWKGDIRESNLETLTTKFNSLKEKFYKKKLNYRYEIQSKNNNTGRWLKNSSGVVINKKSFKKKEKKTEKDEYISKIILFGNYKFSTEWSTWIGGINRQSLNEKIMEFKEKALVNNINYVYFIKRKVGQKWVEDGREIVINSQFIKKKDKIFVEKEILNEGNITNEFNLCSQNL